MRYPAAFALLSLSSLPLLACLNPGDEGYGEMLAAIHLQQMLEKMDGALDSGHTLDETLFAIDAEPPSVRALDDPRVPDTRTTPEAELGSFLSSSDQQLLRSDPEVYWTRRVADLEKAANEKRADFSTTNEYATALIFTGDYKAAIKVLKRQESRFPGRYQTATNLGTAYELAGDPKAALRWISEGVERNPESHRGTEWLHVLILEAKLHQAKEATWLERNFILQERVANPQPDAPANFLFIKAITVQLAERLQFVSAPDPVVSSLFYELGVLYQTIGRDDKAETAFKRSLEFGALRAEEIRKRQNSRVSKI